MSLLVNCTTYKCTYTQEDFKNALIMDGFHYMHLDNPQFEGQTKVDAEGNYYTYFSCEGQLFGYKQNLYK